MTRRSFFQVLAGAFAGTVLARLPLAGRWQAPDGLISEAQALRRDSIAYRTVTMHACGYVSAGTPLYWSENDGGIAAQP